MTAHHDAQAESVLYRRSGNGSWKQVEAGLPPARGMLASVLATHQAEPGVFYAANNLGIFRSSDADVTWEPLPIRWPTNVQTGRIAALALVQE